MSLPRKRMRFIRACRAHASRAARRCARSARSRDGCPGYAEIEHPLALARTAPASGHAARERRRSRHRSRAQASSPASASSARDDGQHVARLARPDAADDRAAVGQDLDQALDRQHLEGFAQRRARNPQLFAQLLLDDAAAFRQVALDDQVAQPRRHGLVQRAPCDRAAGVERGTSRSGQSSCVTGSSSESSSTTDGNSVKIASVISNGG